MPIPHRHYNETQDLPSLGIWNTRAKGRYPLGAADTANNVDILPDANDKFGYEIRQGYTQSRSFTNATASYTTSDGERMFVVDNGTLLEVFANFTTVILATGMGTGSYSFISVGARILVLGANSKLIQGQECVDFFIPQAQTPDLTVTNGDLAEGQYTLATCLVDRLGRRGPLSPVRTLEMGNPNGILIEVPSVFGYTTLGFCTTANGEVLYELGEVDGSYVVTGDLTNLVVPVSEEQVGSTSLPEFRFCEHYDGRLWLSVYSASQDATYVFYSEPYWLNLFNPARNYIAVPGRLNSMDSTQGSLVLTTSREIFSYKDGSLESVVDYGTVKGSPTSRDDATDKLYLWTVRGVCELFPFKNLTEEKVSLPSGSIASTAFLNVKGTKRFMVLTDTLGNTFNKY